MNIKETEELNNRIDKLEFRILNLESEQVRKDEIIEVINKEIFKDNKMVFDI